MSDSIEKQIELKAPVGRVWRALTDYRQFSEWFRVKMEAPFVPGEKAFGQMTYPGYEHVRMEVTVREMTPETLFSYNWLPYAIDPKKDYAGEEPTLVTFTLSEITGGTLLTVVESGFDKVPAERRAEAFRMNERGWTGQLKNIEAYVAAHA